MLSVRVVLFLSLLDLLFSSFYLIQIDCPSESCLYIVPHLAKAKCFPTNYETACRFLTDVHPPGCSFPSVSNQERVLTFVRLFKLYLSS